MDVARRTLVGTVGYHNLRNHSIGPLLLPQLVRLRWPERVQVEELNWGPVAVAQRLQEERPPFARIVLVGARAQQQPEGTITLYRWVGGLPEPRAVQARIGEAISGVISLDNLLIVGEHLKVWPEEVYVIDVAPGSEQSGPDLTPEVAAQVPRVLDLVFDVAVSGRATGHSTVPLAGGGLSPEIDPTGSKPVVSRLQ